MNIIMWMLLTSVKAKLYQALYELARSRTAQASAFAEAEALKLLLLIMRQKYGTLVIVGHLSNDWQYLANDLYLKGLLKLKFHGPSCF